MKSSLNSLISLTSLKKHSTTLSYPYATPLYPFPIYPYLPTPSDTQHCHPERSERCD
jgi:hypothetical protein